MIELKDDKLNRQDFLNNLFDIFSTFGNQDGQGLTIAINGKYGTGKTTLINFICEKNTEMGKPFNIVVYDAWKGNLFEHPLIPLMHTISKLTSKGDKIAKQAKKVVKHLPKIFLKSLLNKCNIDTSDLNSEQDILKEYEEFEKAVKDCKETLTEFCANKKTILLVDELDRCLPEYQIKVLESLYHFLNIPNLIIVITLDRDQLEESIKNQFGSYTDTFGYLSKFIQYDIDLPNDETHNYATELMTFRSDYNEQTKQTIALMLKSINISTRDMKIFVQKLNLICKEKKNGFGQPTNYYYFYPILIAFLLIIKQHNLKIYKKYFGEEKEQTFSNNQIPIENTIFQKFRNEIKTTNLNNLFQVIIESPFGQPLTIDLINLFDNVNTIKIEDIANLIKTTPEQTQKIVNHIEALNWKFPRNINGLIKELQIIK